MKVEIGPASPEDIAHFARGDGSWPTMRAWVAKEDGEPIALFGFSRNTDGRWAAFFDITDKARWHKKLIVKSGRMLMDEARKMGLRYVYARPDPEELLAERWLQSLGFERVGTLMRWTNG